MVVAGVVGFKPNNSIIAIDTVFFGASSGHSDVGSGGVGRWDVGNVLVGVGICGVDCFEYIF